MKELFEEYPYLEGENLILRKLNMSDADALAELTSRKKVYETLPTFLYELKYPDKRKAIALMDAECFDTCLSVLLGVFMKEKPEQLIGIAEIYNYVAKKKKASIGYRIHDAYWGQGFATEVVFLLRSYLTESLYLDTVTAHVLKSNKASARVLIKTGFVDKYPDLYEDWGFSELMLTDKYSFKSSWNIDDDETIKLPDVRIEQFVMAYRVDQDRIRAMLPTGYISLRPVLRINSEIRDEKVLYLEFNTPVESDGRRGWINIDKWKSTYDDISYSREGNTVTVRAPFLTLKYTETGIQGGCPSEKDNEGCYYPGNDLEFIPAEKIDQYKEFCDCEFAWSFHEGDAHGKSEGRTIPAEFTPQKKNYAECSFTAENAAAISCEQVLGSYIVRFTRFLKKI